MTAMTEEEARALKPAKCSIEDGIRVVPCWALDEVTADNNPLGNRKGVMSWTLLKMNQSPPKVSLHIYGVKSGKHDKNGVCFNYCPFCGEKINPRDDGDEAGGPSR